MNIPYYHVDAFTDQIFAGNPAGVCLLESWPDDVLLSNIAAENNLPETAFIVQNGAQYQLRWFTPEVEIDLCGHATLASAFVLHLNNPALQPTITFETRSGILSVEKQGDLFMMNFPSRKAEPCGTVPEITTGLGAQPQSIHKSRDYLAVFATEDEVQALQPDFDTLATLDCLGIIATAPGKTVDFVSRFFAPGAGIAEDPVTGSSHCTLIPFWAEQTGKNILTARQVSERGGSLYCELKDKRVNIGGYARLYMSGKLIL